MPPLDIGSDADIEAYKSALETLLQGDGADAILLIHAPSLTARGVTLASSLIDFIKQHPRARRFNILTNWAGEYSAQEGRRLFNEAGIPTYRTPESAVTAFMHMVEYRRNQKQLMETRPPCRATGSMSSAASSSLGKRWTASSGCWTPTWPIPSCRQPGYPPSRPGSFPMPSRPH